jgi:dTDP-4-amino-4,6-dideoxygalactose transaminase
MTLRNATATQLIPVMRPLLPAADQLLPYLRRIDDARYYSNHGPLLLEFEQRLAAFFGLRATEVTTASNGTTALSAALLAVEAAPGKKCLVPSWTFVASAAAIWAANLKPHFVDVSLASWMLDPDVIRARTDLADVGAVMVVSAFGAPVDVAAWDRFTTDTGIPVIIDAAAAFDTVASIPKSAPGRSLMMISFHATKVFGVGEGALVLSTDDELVRRVRQICNFGVWDEPQGQILGYNGKLSEYHAAVGLAALDGWPQRRAAIDGVTQWFVDGLRDTVGVAVTPGYGAGWVSCYCNVAVNRPIDDLIARLRDRGIETRRWWQRGVDTQPAYRGFSHDKLPITQRLGASVFALPFFHDIGREDVDRVLKTLRSLLA